MQPQAPEKTIETHESELRRPSVNIGTGTEPCRPYICPPVLTEYPARVICPNCHAQVLTRTQYVNGFLTWACATGLFLLGLIKHFNFINY